MLFQGQSRYRGFLSMGLPPKIIHSNRIFHEINIQKPSMFGSPQFRKTAPPRSSAFSVAGVRLGSCSDQLRDHFGVAAPTRSVMQRCVAQVSSDPPQLDGLFMVISWKIPHKCMISGGFASNTNQIIKWGDPYRMGDPNIMVIANFLGN